MEYKRKLIKNFLMIIIGISVVLQVIILNKHSTIGDELTLVNKKIDEIENENNSMSQKIASLSAMTTITQKAKQYGLAAVMQVISISTSLPIASSLKLSL